MAAVLTAEQVTESPGGPRGALTLLTYLFLYTPLKRKTSLCVLVGAFPGAMLPLIGWAGASGRLNIDGGVLCAIVFLLQFPHFMAIAWMYREDYDRAGYLVLPKEKTRIPFVILETHLPLIVLVGCSVVQFPARHATIFYCAATLLGFGFLYFGVEFTLRRSRAAARRLLAASIVYLPLLFVLIATLCNRGRSGFYFDMPDASVVKARRRSLTLRSLTV